jgi:hypothetical protein
MPSTPNSAAPIQKTSNQIVELKRAFMTSSKELVYRAIRRTDRKQ